MSALQNEKVQAHHPDYKHPLIVEWVCVRNHVILDKERRRKEQAE